MIRRGIAASSIAVAVLLAACATEPASRSNGVLADGKGMTLYNFDKDVRGSAKSACNGPCAQNWPPFMATANDKANGDWSIVTREDGSRQWAYKGKPLYRWSRDQKPGDRSGDGFNRLWHAQTYDEPFTVVGY